MFIGEPYVIECPNCGKLHVVSVTFGSGAFSCECCPNEFIHFDFISADSIKKNQQKYSKLIDDYMKTVNEQLTL